MVSNAKLCVPSSHEGDVFSSILFFFIKNYPRKIKCLEISEERRYVDLEASEESCQMSPFKIKENIFRKCKYLFSQYLFSYIFIHRNLVKLLPSEF